MKHHIPQRRNSYSEKLAITYPVINLSITNCETTLLYAPLDLVTVNMK